MYPPSLENDPSSPMTGFKRPRKQFERSNDQRGGPNPSYNKRRSYGSANMEQHNMTEEIFSVEDQIAHKIFEFGDKTESSNEELYYREFVDIINSDSMRYKSSIVEAFLDCISEMPWKTSTYSSLVAILYLQNKDLAMSILDQCRERLVKHFEKGDWNHILLLTRFLADLVNVNIIDGNSWLSFLNQFTLTLKNQSISIQGKYYHSYLVLSSMIWNGKYLSKYHEAELNHLLISVLGDFVHRMKEANSKLKLNYHSSDMVIDLYQRIIDLKDNKNWDYDIITTPYHSFPALASANIEPCNLSLLLNIPELTDRTGLLYPNYRFAFRLYLASTLESDLDGHLPFENSIERWILYDIISKTIYFANMNYKICWDLIVSIKWNSPKLNVNKILVETIVSEMLALPDSHHKLAYYTLLLVQGLSKVVKMAKPIGEAIHKLFYGASSTVSIDFLQLCKFSDWFSMHLSNFDFKWKWDTWENSFKDTGLRLENKEIPVIFLKDLLIKLTGLSYYERIKAIITPFFQPFMPHEPDPNFEYKVVMADGENEQKQNPNYNAKLNQWVEKLCVLIRTRESTNQIQSYIDALDPNELDIMASQDIHKLKKRILTQSILFIGSKSFSHSLNAVEKYTSLLQSLNNMEQGFDMECVEMLDIIADFWKFNSQYLVFLTDKLVNYKVISPLSVILWAFNEKNQGHLNYSWFWAIVTRVFKKVQSRELLPQDKSVHEMVEYESHSGKFYTLFFEKLVEHAQDFVSTELDMEKLKVSFIQNSSFSYLRFYISKYPHISKIYIGRLLTEAVNLNPFLKGVLRELLDIY